MLLQTAVVFGIGIIVFVFDVGYANASCEVSRKMESQAYFVFGIVLTNHDHDFNTLV
jgi:hypothetical protein